MEQIINSKAFKQAKENMSREDLDFYARLGEQFYTDFDMEEGAPHYDPVKSVAEEIGLMLRSGMHPSALDDNEKNVLRSVYGDEWYSRFGYIKEDLERIRL